MKAKFFVLALPRSRTFWLSEFLGTPTCRVLHDGSCEYPTVADMLDGDFDGMVDTALVLHWRALRGKMVLIDRPVKDCIESAREMGFRDVEPVMHTLRRAFDEAARVHPVVDYADLGKEHVCRHLFEYLTGEDFDRERWSRLDQTVMTVSVPDELRRFAARKSNIESMYGEFRHA